MSRSPLVLLLLAACEGGQSPTETATVGALRVPCVGFIQQTCLLMTQDGEQRREFFGIDGYTHRWGTESEITFRREPIDPPLADGPSENLILLDIIQESEPITGPFQLDFPSSGAPGWFSESGANLEMSGTTVKCETDVCNQLVAADGSDAAFTVTMELTDDPQTLRATAVSP